MAEERRVGDFKPLFIANEGEDGRRKGSPVSSTTSDNFVVLDSVESDEDNTEKENELKLLNKKLQKELKILREENVRLKNQINNLISNKTPTDNSPAVQVSFRNNSLAKKYRTEVEKFLRVLLSKEDIWNSCVFTSYNNTGGGQLQFFQNFCVDNIYSTDEEVETTPQKTWNVPVYDQCYTEDVNTESFGKELSKEESNIVQAVTCFNCTGNHTVTNCPEKLDQKKIYENRRKFSQNRSNTTSSRYHEDLDQNQKFKAGVISENLRKALDLEPHQLPRFIYHMRILGYPPGWLKMAKVESSGLTLYDHDGKPTTEAEEEEGEIETDSPRVQYDPRKLVSYPGFNIPMPHGYVDEYQKLRMPTMQLHQLRSEAEKQMKAPEANPYRKRKLDVTKSDKKYKIEKLEQDVKYMDVDQIGSENASSDKYVPPLPPGEEYAGSSLIVCDRGKFGSQNTSRRASPTLIDLEEAKQRLMSELEEAITMNVSQMDCVSKYSNSLSVTAGTPIVTGHSSYSTLPAAHKFSEGVSPYLPFDNLPDSVGTYEKMKDVVMKVRQRLQTLK